MPDKPDDEAYQDESACNKNVSVYGGTIYITVVIGHGNLPIDAADMRTCSVVESRRSSSLLFSPLFLPSPRFRPSDVDVGAVSARAVPLTIDGADNVEVTKLNGKSVSVSTPFLGWDSIGLGWPTVIRGMNAVNVGALILVSPPALSANESHFGGCLP